MNVFRLCSSAIAITLGGSRERCTYVRGKKGVSVVAVVPAMMEYGNMGPLGLLWHLSDHN